MNHPRSQSAFTLIELLVVISIIAILAALAIPATSGALESAKRTQAKNDAVQIATAITAYETEYGRLPLGGATGDTTAGNTAALFSALAGDTGGTIPNPRRITFLEVPAAGNNNRNGTNASGVFVDSWSNPYLIAMDGNYDNILTGLPGSTGDVRKRVAVWSQGKDPGRTERFIKSWE